jgi:Protein of unknown function (DUF3631)
MKCALNVPGLPDGITGRFREKWAPLKRVAAAAGGDWPDRVDAMALHDKEQREMDKEDGLLREAPAAVLLRHIYEVWPDGTPFLATVDLIEKLVAEHPFVWGEEGPIGKRLTAQRLGRMLVAGYKINSSRETNYGPRGYPRTAFTRPWSRLRITLSDKPAQVAFPAEPASEPSSRKSATSATGGPYDTCQTPGCGRNLIQPASRQRGICESCYVHGPMNGDRT